MRNCSPLANLLHLAPPALADACRERVVATFDGGPLDPFARAPHSYVTTISGPDGSVTSTCHAMHESPVPAMGWSDGNPMQTLILGSESWIRMGEDRDWMATPNMLPEDHAGFVRSQIAQQITNLKDVACPGLMVMEDRQFDVVRNFTKTEPDPASSDAWFGAANAVFLEPETQRVIRWETTQAVSSFAPTPSNDTQVIVCKYDADVTLPKPPE